MKLSEWAKQQGISYKTAWRWYTEGKLPVPAEQIATGTIIVHVPEEKKAGTLDSQVARVLAYANSRGLSVSSTITEVGSGLNGHRPKLMKLLQDPQITTIVVEHRDRLMRFGFEYVEAALASQGRRVLVVDPAELKDDPVQDMISVLTSFCARLYGRRAAKDKAEKAMKAIQGKGPDEDE